MSDLEQAFQKLIYTAMKKVIHECSKELEEAALNRERLFSVSELSKYFGFSETTIRNWINRDYDPLPAFQVQKEYRIHLNVFLEWLEQYRVENKTRVGKIINIQK